ncbi:hypothetical protein PENTCL1PPCAC_684, partial [Pristionchus entomophagus]
IRACFVNAIFRVILGSGARIIILHHQYFGSDDAIWLTMASCHREAFLNFFNGAYEKESPATILVFVANEIILDSISWTNTICLVFEYVSIYTNAMVMACLLMAGAFSFVVLYRFNLKEIAHIKKGAVVNSYSISRSFQIRENIAVFQMMLRVVFPTVIFNGPAYFFFFAYLLIPADCGHDFMKHISIAMFDLWISIAYRRGSQTEADVYFKMFTLDMNKLFQCCMIFAQLLALPVVTYRMYRTKALHRNIRLLLIHTFISTGMSSVCRLGLIYFQYTGIPSPGSGKAIIVLLASIGRELGLGIVVSIPFIIAIERMVATRHWSWWVHFAQRFIDVTPSSKLDMMCSENIRLFFIKINRYEKEAIGTLWVFVLTLFISVFAALINGVCFIYGLYHEVGNLLAFAIIIAFGMAALAYIYHRNVVQMRKISLGARVNGYSVSHSYQIRENVTLMKFLFKLIVPSLMFAGPSFIAFTIFILLPNEADFFRHISVALFDIFVEGFHMMISVFLWYFVPRLRQNASLPTLDSAQETNQYFDWLTRDLNRVAVSHNGNSVHTAI